MKDIRIREGEEVKFEYFVEKGELNSDTKFGIFHRWADSYLHIDDKKIPFTIAIVEVMGNIYQASPEGIAAVR